ncbi:MAG TPA: heme ABC exporter ATP-binding protein CcmA [Microthrixaceae bacterium]|nr:heme ABC exporter ATP-binding protein CcmA [Microthrixaceae bacterium]
MAPIVRLRSAVALLGRFPALAGVDLDVGRGEILLLRGPNGAGKTTLLRVCAGLVPVTSGTATVLGEDLVRDRTAVRRRVGLLGHATHLYQDLTVAENVSFWARASGSTVEEGRAALERLGVARRLWDLPVHALSAGQRRRTSFAAMVCRRPELWLLDEPHAGLDREGRDIVDGLMVEAASVGATVVFASHELDRATGVAHRSVTVEGGVVQGGLLAGDAVPAGRGS